MFLILASIPISGCYTLKEPMISQNQSVTEYEYVYIPETGNVSGSVVVPGTYGVSGYSKEINPGSIIEGILLKRGFKSLDSLRPDFLDKTLVVQYGESGTRKVGFLGGYTIEVTISFYSAKEYETVYSCTAEGIGSTEADDIRKAVNRCLSGLPSKVNSTLINQNN